MNTIIQLLNNKYLSKMEIDEKQKQTNKLRAALQAYEGVKGRYSNPRIVQFRLEQLKGRIKKEGK